MANLSFTIGSADLQQSTGSYTPVPAGTYNANIYDIEVLEVKNGENAGKPQFKIQFRIADGQYENRRVFSYVPLYTGKTFWKTQSFFEALGYDMKEGKFTVPAPKDLMGKILGIKLKVVQGLEGDENNVSGFVALKAAAGGLDSLGAKEIDPEETW